ALAPCLHQGDSRARDIPQGTYVRRRHKAGPDESMGQQLGDPGCIPFVRLFARAATHLMRVADEHLDRTREDVIDRLPIHASRNLAKTILEWEYSVEIERTRLLMRPAEQCPASLSDAVSSH